jgi:diguanylate cyclase (GGDEF)-like protein/PAS domain S-box-containing protein
MPLLFFNDETKPTLSFRGLLRIATDKNKHPIMPEDTVGEIQLKFSELTGILEQMPAGVAIAEVPSGKLLFHNREAVLLLGHPMRPSDDTAGYVGYGAEHADGRPYLSREYPIARAVRGEVVPPEEMCYRRGDGALICLLVNAAPIRDREGNIVKAVSTFFDISEQKQVQQALAQTQERLIDALGCGDLILWSLDLPESRLQLIGETASLLGHGHDALPHDLDGWLALIHPDDRAAFSGALARHLAGQASDIDVEYRVRRPNNTWKWLLTRGRARHFDSAGKVLNVAGSHLDISARKKIASRLNEAEARLALAVSIAELGMWEWNIQTGEVYFSPQWKRHLGYQDHELPNRFDEWESRLHPADRERVLAYLYGYVRQPVGDYHIEFRVRHRDGSYRWIEVRAQMLMDDKGQPLRLTGTHLDISEHKDREEQVRMVVQHDPLTGLPNRALVLELAERWLSAARRSGKLFAVMFIDLDEFKPINDTYGHHIGDEVLKEVALRLRASFRSHDLIGRLGGDEFLVIVTQLENALGAAHAAAHLLQQVAMPYRIGDLTLRTTPSIGISLFPEHGDDIDTLIRHADSAMYEAKQGGKGNYRFFSTTHDDAPVSPLESNLRGGHGWKSLQLHFQPIIDLGTHRLIAAEALLRWPAAQGGGMSADALVALAEQQGFIMELGKWVLQQACAQHQLWLRQGLPAVPLGVNLSAMQFRDADLPRAIAAGISESQVDPCFLSVEVSDRAFTGDLRYARTALERLKAIGIAITLDDFGAGYANLEQLSRLPIDRVKIDRSLITALPEDKTSIAVTEAALSFGHSLGIEMVAEGLESQQVLEFLQRRHCDRAQGYYLARPMPGAEFAEWYRHAGLH